MWERTDDPVFLEEEREKALESMFDADLVTNREEFSLAPKGPDGNTCIHLWQ